MQMRIARYLVIVGLAAIGAGCRDGTGTSSSVRAAAGLYVLSTVNGEPIPTSDPYAPISGTVYLWPTGQAERHVAYRISNGGTQSLESVGTFHFENDVIVLELRAKGDNTPTAWRVSGSLDNGTLTLGYPGPADGWIKEEYRRK